MRCASCTPARDVPGKVWRTSMTARPDSAVACGRTERAVEEARARAQANRWYDAQNLAGLLSGVGRPEEAFPWSSGD